jgi:hypothetical protein
MWVPWTSQESRVNELIKILYYRQQFKSNIHWIKVFFGQVESNNKQICSDFMSLNFDGALMKKVRI